MNQFYVYDVMMEMERRMAPGDTLLVCDADCLCRHPLDSLFQAVRQTGSALYDMQYPQDYLINGTTLKDMETVYSGCYGRQPAPICYYGGEFIALRADAVAACAVSSPRCGTTTSTSRPMPRGCTRRHTCSACWPSASACATTRATAT